MLNSFFEIISKFQIKPSFTVNKENLPHSYEHIGNGKNEEHEQGQYGDNEVWHKASTATGTRSVRHNTPLGYFFIRKVASRRDVHVPEVVFHTSAVLINWLLQVRINNNNNHN